MTHLYVYVTHSYLSHDSLTDFDESWDKNESRCLDAGGEMKGERVEEQDIEKESERQSERDRKMIIAFIITLGEII